MYILIVLFASCQSAEVVVKKADNSLNSTLWIQTSAEYEALSYQAYNTSVHLLEAAPADSSWTAAVEQGETISNFRRPSSSIWMKHPLIVREMEAEAIKGAVELTSRADELGISIYYITNRDAAVQEATEENLRNPGFPVAEGTAMSNSSRPEWTSAKTDPLKTKRD